MADEEEITKHRVTVVISSLGNERRVISLGEMEDEAVKQIFRNIDAAFGTVRTSNALMLSDANGMTTFANLDNVAFIEVQIG